MTKRVKELDLRPTQGFSIPDEVHIRQFDNPRADPEIQLFTGENLEDDELEIKKYFCAACKTQLEYLQGIEEWFCEGCSQIYDTKVQNKPIKDNTDFKLVPYTDLQWYPTFDENDERVPFVQAIDVDDLAGDAQEIQLVKQTPDHRIKTYRVKGLPTEALAAVEELEDR